MPTEVPAPSLSMSTPTTTNDQTGAKSAAPHLQRLNADSGAGALALDVHHLASNQALAANRLANLGTGAAQGRDGTHVRLTANLCTFVSLASSAGQRMHPSQSPQSARRPARRPRKQRPAPCFANSTDGSNRITPPAIRPPAMCNGCFCSTAALLLTAGLLNCCSCSPPR